MHNFPLHGGALMLLIEVGGVDLLGLVVVVLISLLDFEGLLEVLSGFVTVVLVLPDRLHGRRVVLQRTALRRRFALEVFVLGSPITYLALAITDCPAA